MVLALTAILLTSPDNMLTSAEKKAGWKLMFDGKTTNGWTNFRTDTIQPGWVVNGGALVNQDLEHAGDIVSTGQYKWFELQLDFNITQGGNSGIMYHVSDATDVVWHSGPEIQIYDHKPEKGSEITGYLYQLYGSKVDAAKPAGQWNHFRILISSKTCATWVNGVKYYEFQYGSKDFWDRVAKSKFSEFPEFAKSDSGRIAIQGDHGTVSFKNIKIKQLKK